MDTSSLLMISLTFVILFPLSIAMMGEIRAARRKQTQEEVHGERYIESLKVLIANYIRSNDFSEYSTFICDPKDHHYYLVRNDDPKDYFFIPVRTSMQASKLHAYLVSRGMYEAKSAGQAGLPPDKTQLVVFKRSSIRQKLYAVH